MKDDFDFEPYWLNALFKQGTELVALQRDNLEICNLANDEDRRLPLPHDSVAAVEASLRKPPPWSLRFRPFLVLDFWRESPLWINPAEVCFIMVVRCDKFPP